MGSVWQHAINLVANKMLDIIRHSSTFIQVLGCVSQSNFINRSHDLLDHVISRCPPKFKIANAQCHWSSEEVESSRDLYQQHEVLYNVKDGNYTGTFCCVPLCHNSSGRDKNLRNKRSYYPLPTDEKR